MSNIQDVYQFREKRLKSQAKQQAIKLIEEDKPTQVNVVETIKLSGVKDEAKRLAAWPAVYASKSQENIFENWPAIHDVKSKWKVPFFMGTSTRWGSGEWTWDDMLQQATLPYYLEPSNLESQRHLITAIGEFGYASEFWTVVLTHILFGELPNNGTFSELGSALTPKFSNDRTIRGPNGLHLTIVLGGIPLQGIGLNKEFYDLNDARKIYKKELRAQQILLDAILLREKPSEHIRFPMCSMATYQGTTCFVELDMSDWIDDTENPSSGLKDAKAELFDLEISLGPVMFRKALTHIFDDEFAGSDKKFGNRLKFVHMDSKYVVRNLHSMMNDCFTNGLRVDSFTGWLGLSFSSSNHIPGMPSIAVPRNSMVTEHEAIDVLFSLINARVVDFNSPERIAMAIRAYGLRVNQTLPCIIYPNGLRVDLDVPQFIKRAASMDLLGRAVKRLFRTRIHQDSKIDSSFQRQDVFVNLLNKVIDRDQMIIDEIMGLLLENYSILGGNSINVFWIREWKYFYDICDASEFVTYICHHCFCLFSESSTAVQDENQNQNTSNKLVYIKEDLETFLDVPSGSPHLKEDRLIGRSLLFPSRKNIADQIGNLKNLNGFYPSVHTIYPRSLSVYRNALLQILLRDVTNIHRTDRMLCPMLAHHTLNQSLYRIEDANEVHFGDLIWYLARNTTSYQTPNVGAYCSNNRDETFPCNPGCVPLNNRCQNLSILEESIIEIIDFHNRLQHYGEGIYSAYCAVFALSKAKLVHREFDCIQINDYIIEECCMNKSFLFDVSGMSCVGEFMSYDFERGCKRLFRTLMNFQIIDRGWIQTEQLMSYDYVPAQLEEWKKMTKWIQMEGQYSLSAATILLEIAWIMIKMSVDRRKQFAEVAFREDIDGVTDSSSKTLSAAGIFAFVVTNAITSMFPKGHLISLLSKIVIAKSMFEGHRSYNAVNMLKSATFSLVPYLSKTSTDRGIQSQRRFPPGLMFSTSLMVVDSMILMSNNDRASLSIQSGPGSISLEESLSVVKTAKDVLGEAHRLTMKAMLSAVEVYMYHGINSKSSDPLESKGLRKPVNARALLADLEARYNNHEANNKLNIALDIIQRYFKVAISRCIIPLQEQVIQFQGDSEVLVDSLRHPNCKTPIFLEDDDEKEISTHYVMKPFNEWIAGINPKRLSQLKKVCDYTINLSVYVTKLKDWKNLISVYGNVVTGQSFLNGINEEERMSKPKGLMKSVTFFRSRENKTTDEVSLWNSKPSMSFPLNAATITRIELMIKQCTFYSRDELTAKCLMDTLMACSFARNRDIRKKIQCFCLKI
eukprot:GHVH01000978.1.p1 GENE.GHVH01000978.1~~GHVH01000978.1.p1  ORF type:complete len:1302 (-),score=153.88 GHVH01000978.1:174-4079(-)